MSNQPTQARSRITHAMLSRAFARGSADRALGMSSRKLHADAAREDLTARYGSSITTTLMCYYYMAYDNQ